MNLLQRVYHFFTEGIWDVELSALSWPARWGVNFVRIVHLVYSGFRKNECPLHASALTYSSLMALVPVMALALALLRGLGAGDKAENYIVSATSAMPPQFQQLIEKALSYVHNTNFATLGGIGLAVLLWIAVQMIGRVEMSFNRVWGVHSSRPLLRKFSDYLSVLLVVPVLIITATTINTTLNSPHIVNLLSARLGFVHDWYLRSLELTPIASVCLAFTFLYKFMPNTRVRVGPAFLSGIIGGSLWLGWQRIYIATQIGVNNYNKIYAAFASIPIFLFWLYVSWQIVLIGAEIGFALQNYATYKLELRAHDASTQSRIMLALSIISHAAQSMMINVPHFEVSLYARKHGVPVRLINEVLDALVGAKLMAEVAEGDDRYVLLKTPEMIRVREVMEILTQTGSSPQELGLDRLNPAIRHIVGKADNGVAETLQDFNIPDLLRLHSRLAEQETSNV